MREIGKPCSARDITTFLVKNKLSNISSDIITDVCYVLNRLRAWETIDKFPDLHGINSNLWYIVGSTIKHNSKKCKYCRGITKAHNKNIAQFMIRSTNRKVKLNEDQEDIVFKEEEQQINKS